MLVIKMLPNTDYDTAITTIFIFQRTLSLD